MKTSLVAVVFVLVSTVAMAETYPINLSLTPGLALHEPDDRIDGLTLSIWGQNPQSSLAIGLVNGTAGRSAGASLGILNYSESYLGVQWGVVNYASDDFIGWQGGFVLGLVGSVVNYTEGTMHGFQCGLVNYAGVLNGFQLGVVNYASIADPGVQIGLVNIIYNNDEWFTNLPDEIAPAMLIVNWRF